MMSLGTAAPLFSLLDTQSGKEVGLKDIKGNAGTVIMFLCNHCPFVIHVNPEISRMAKEYLSQGIGFAAISSNDALRYPQDGPDLMKAHALKNDYVFPYLYDETQEIAKAYDAACTPDFYIFDANLKLVYRGQLDSSRPENTIPLTGADIRNALNALLAGEAIPEQQRPSMGCSIKWKHQ